MLKKKVRIFGKTVPAFLIVLVLMATMGSALLVNYLSNKVTATANVASPVKLSIGLPSGLNDWRVWSDYMEVPMNGWDADDSLDLGDIHGGVSRTFWIKAENLAEAEQLSNLVFRVVCTKNIDYQEDPLNVGDFDAAISIFDWEPDGTPTKRYNTLELESNGGFLNTNLVSPTDLRIWRPTSYLFPSGSDGDIYYVRIDIHFAGGADGEYTIDAAWLTDPTGSFPGDTV